MKRVHPQPQPAGRAMLEMGSKLLESSSQGKLLYNLKCSADAIEAIVFSPDRRLLAAGGRDGTGRLWDVGGSKPGERATFKIAGGVRSLAFAPNGRNLAAGSATGQVSLFEFSSTGLRETRILRGGKASIDALAYSPNGNLVAGGGEDSTLRIWEPGTGLGNEPKTTLQGHTQSIRTVAFAPDGKSLATGARDSMLRTWTLSGIRPGMQLVLPNTGDISTAAYSPDGKTLVAAGTDQVIWLWDLAALKPAVRTRLPGHLAGTRLVMITTDAETVVSVGAASNVMNWSPRSGRLRKEWALPAGPATRFALTPDGRYMARGLAKGDVEVFRIAEKRTAGISHNGEPVA